MAKQLYTRTVLSIQALEDRVMLSSAPLGPIMSAHHYSPPAAYSPPSFIVDYSTPSFTGPSGSGTGSAGGPVISGGPASPGGTATPSTVTNADGSTTTHNADGSTTQTMPPSTDSNGNPTSDVRTTDKNGNTTQTATGSDAKGNPQETVLTENKAKTLVTIKVYTKNACGQWVEVKAECHYWKKGNDNRWHMDGNTAIESNPPPSPTAPK